MASLLVFPMHDPQGLLFPHVRQITSYLHPTFAAAYVSVSVETQAVQPEHVAWLVQHPFYHVLAHAHPLPVGEEFHALYTFAATAAAPQDILHLCFADRLAFSLQGAYRDQFLTDMRSTTHAHTPLIYQRSAANWATHPSNYAVIERCATTIGALLFHQDLDFAWCHLAITAQLLSTALRQSTVADISLLAALILAIRTEVQTKTVDWLAWEDPFLFARDPDELRTEREQAQQETVKRLRYLVPTLNLMLQAIQHGELPAA